MPIYAYRCKKCGSEEEHIQRMSDPPVTKCEACGGRLDRLLSPAAFHLKGGGWYRDGYASAKPGGEAKSDGSGEGAKKDKKEKKEKKAKQATTGEGGGGKPVQKAS
jgi:putative FmdB family regulatory protein